MHTYVRDEVPSSADRCHAQCNEPEGLEMYSCGLVRRHRLKHMFEIIANQDVREYNYMGNSSALISDPWLLLCSE